MHPVPTFVHPMPSGHEGIGRNRLSIVSLTCMNVDTFMIYVFYHDNMLVMSPVIKIDKGSVQINVVCESVSLCV